MKKLLLGEPGTWVRGNGEVVAIEDMIDPHLFNARRIVDGKLVEATLTRVRIEGLQETFGTKEDPQAIATLAECVEIVEALQAKRDELTAEMEERAISKG